MARIQHGPVVASASGRIGGVVIRQTRFGPVAQTAYDVPSYQTAPALAAKARFRTAQRAWSIMPTDLSDLLRACHRALHAGIPGPWITAMLAASVGTPWHYLPATNPEIEFHISSINWIGQDYQIWYWPDLPSGWQDCWYLLFHPINGVHPEVRWRKKSFGNDYVLIPRIWWEPGLHIVILPSTWKAYDAVGRGDVAELPSS